MIGPELRPLGPMALEYADRLASDLVQQLAPACERIEVAGSIRRRRPAVKDIEIVLVSRKVPAGQGSLFEGAPAAWALAVWERLEELRLEGRVVPIKPGSHPLEFDAEWPRKSSTATRYLRLLWAAVQARVDVFVVEAAAFGWQLALRTGPAEISKALVDRWAPAVGLVCEGGRLVRRGVPIDTREEADVWEELQLEPLEPELRLNAAMLQRRRRVGV